MSPCASIQITPGRRPLRAIPARVPMDIEWSPPMTTGKAPLPATWATRSASSVATRTISVTWCARLPPLGRSRSSIGRYFCSARPVAIRDADVAALVAAVAEIDETIAKAGIADRGGSHVAATAVSTEVHWDADDCDVLRG